MRAHGPLLIERFGVGALEGWSALQFIETSSITVHADEVCGRCFVDVFSCRAFDGERRRRGRPGPLRRHVDRDAAASDDRPRRDPRTAGGGGRGRRHDPLRARHAARGDAAAPGDVAHLGRAGRRRVPVAVRRRRVVEPVMAAVQAVLTCGIFVAVHPLGRGRAEPHGPAAHRDRGGRRGRLARRREPLVATACVIVADLLAAAMMVPKTYRDPSPRRSSRSRWRASAAARRGRRRGARRLAAAVPRLLLRRQRRDRAADLRGAGA